MLTSHPVHLNLCSPEWDIFLRRVALQVLKVADDEYGEVGHHRDRLLERHFSLARGGRVRDGRDLGHVGQRNVAVAGGPYQSRVESRLIIKDMREVA